MDVVLEARKVSLTLTSGNEISNLELSIRSTEAHAFFGIKKSGKSEVLQLFYGAKPATRGELFLFGLNIKQNWKKIRGQMAFVPQADLFDLEFCVLDNLLTYGGYLGLFGHEAESTARQLLRALDLDQVSHLYIHELSPAQMRRLAIARALMHKPKILVIDEPTRRLDLSDSEWIWQLLSDLRSQGVTLIFATSRADEVDALASKVTIIHEGKAIITGEVEALRQEAAGESVVEFSCHPADVSYYSAKLRNRYEFHVTDNAFVVFLQVGQDPREVFSYIESNHIRLRKTTVNDAYLKIVQEWGVSA